MTKPYPNLDQFDEILLPLQADQSTEAGRACYEEAWHRLYPILQRMVVGFAGGGLVRSLKKKVGPSIDGDDLVSETALALHKHLAKNRRSGLARISSQQLFRRIGKIAFNRANDIAKFQLQRQLRYRVLRDLAQFPARAPVVHIRKNLIERVLEELPEADNQQALVRSQVRRELAEKFSANSDARGLEETVEIVLEQLQKLKEQGIDTKDVSRQVKLLKNKIAKSTTAAALEDAVLNTFEGFNTNEIDVPDNESTRDSLQEDELDCTAFAPPTANRGAPLLLQVFVHLRSKTDEAEHLAREADFVATRRGRISVPQPVVRGEKLGFDLHAHGADCATPRQELIWRGATESVDFVLIVRQDAVERVAGRIVVNLRGLPIGQIGFSITLKGSEYDRPIYQGGVTFFGSYFASYSSHDRPVVLRCVQTLRLIGKTVRQDILDLDPGDRWEKRLYEFIRECDATLLFWSHHAKESQWVLKECVYCKEQKGVDRILPLILETPPPSPWPELSEIHMNDKLAYLISENRNSSADHQGE